VVGCGALVRVMAGRGGHPPSVDQLVD
jgi:hypothetical protein